MEPISSATRKWADAAINYQLDSEVTLKQIANADELTGALRNKHGCNSGKTLEYHEMRLVPGKVSAGQHAALGKYLEDAVSQKKVCAPDGRVHVYLQELQKPADGRQPHEFTFFAHSANGAKKLATTLAKSALRWKLSPQGINLDREVPREPMLSRFHQATLDNFTAGVKKSPLSHDAKQQAAFEFVKEILNSSKDGDVGRLTALAPRTLIVLRDMLYFDDAGDEAFNTTKNAYVGQLNWALNAIQGGREYANNPKPALGY